jgi:hypothetical protein
MTTLKEGFDGFDDYIVDAMEVVGGNDVRRENVDDIAEGTKKHATFEEKIVQFGAQGGEVAGVIGAEFESRDGADLARVADLMELAEMGEALGVDAGDVGDATEDGLIVKNLEAGICGSAG